MIRLLAGAILVVRLACRRLDVDWELCMAIWRSRPPIVQVMEDPAARKKELVVRLDRVFPF